MKKNEAMKLVDKINESIETDEKITIYSKLNGGSFVYGKFSHATCKPDRSWQYLKNSGIIKDNNEPDYNIVIVYTPYKYKKLYNVNLKASSFAIYKGYWMNGQGIHYYRLGTSFLDYLSTSDMKKRIDECKEKPAITYFNYLGEDVA